MTQTVTVKRLWDETPEIRCLELAPADGTPLAFEPGAHVEVHLPDKMIRQYSLWNGPADQSSILIGVKKEPQSRGGSVAMHSLSEGDTLVIGAPRNNFALHDNDGPAILLAGGIGITPLLAMARHRAAQNRLCTLHLFARDASHAPFSKELSDLPEAPVHLGLNPPTLNKVIGGILSNADPMAHLYLCGPGPFMDLVEREAALAGWPADHIHLERFSIDPDTLELDGDSFEVVLRQSGKTIQVEPEQTIIEAMELAGIEPLTSCEQGVCGTCMTTVIDGVPDHRDQYLNDDEKAAGTLIMPCVSRCKGPRLVLDL